MCLPYWMICVILVPVLPVTVGGSAPFFGGILLTPDLYREGVVGMITWTELLAFGMFIMGLISLVLQIIDKKK